MKSVIRLFIIFLLLSSCTSKNIIHKSNYEHAMYNLKLGNFNMAAEIFEKIEDEQPFTKSAVNGLIMSSYSYYKAKQYEDSIRVINYFIQSNPINENLSYMYYLRSLNYFDRIKSMSKSRDNIENAGYALNELIYKYPNSEYVEDSKKRLKIVDTYLSGNEMTIAQYYLKRKNYIGAMNHYTNVIKNYPKSNFLPESLYRMVEINLLLNIKLEAVQYHELLNKNFKDSTWAKYSTKFVKQYEN